MVNYLVILLFESILFNLLYLFLGMSFDDEVEDIDWSYYVIKFCFYVDVVFVE